MSTRSNGRNGSSPSSAKTAPTCGHPGEAVSWLSAGTGICPKCASERAAVALSSPAARTWLESWESRLRAALRDGAAARAPGGRFEALTFLR